MSFIKQSRHLLVLSHIALLAVFLIGYAPSARAIDPLHLENHSLCATYSFIVLVGYEHLMSNAEGMGCQPSDDGGGQYWWTGLQADYAHPTEITVDPNTAVDVPLFQYIDMALTGMTAGFVELPPECNYARLENIIIIYWSDCGDSGSYMITYGAPAQGFGDSTSCPCD